MAHHRQQPHCVRDFDYQKTESNLFLKYKLIVFAAISLFLTMSKSVYGSGSSLAKVADITSGYAKERCSTPLKAK